MPARKGPENAGVAAAFYTRASNRRHNMVLRVGSSSILTDNFNDLWCYGLNLQCIKGLKIPYFAMLHDDIEPLDEGWLDQLIEEVEAGPYDVVSAIVPIKDHRGVTSTGLGLPGDEHRWSPHRRFTMREVCGLPRTFTAEDIGEGDKILLVNSGCWVCRFDQPWREEFCFKTENTIVRDEATGGFRARVQPEDWHASRQFHAMGLRVAATSRIRLKHWGLGQYTNTHAWGSWEHDQAGKAHQEVAAT